MKQGLVTIVTPLYNAEKYIKETIDSVKSQTYSNWEWFIVDDCSTDNGVEVTRELIKGDDRIHLILKTTNDGTAKTRNQGLKRANGQYITFIDADDLWNKEFLEKQINFMKENNCPFVFSSYLRKSDKTSSIFVVPEKVTYKNILKTCSISCLTSIYDASILGVELMREDLRKREDMACWLQILKRTPFALGNKECLATYRILQNSKSHKKMRVIKYQWAVYRKVEKMNIFRSFYYLCFWAINGIKKYRGVK